MGFLNQISSVFHSDAYKNNQTKKISFLSNGLVQHDLKADTFQSSTNAKKSTSIDNNVLFVPIDRNYVRFIKTYLNKQTIENAIAKNPNIAAILAEYNLPCEYNLENVNSIIMSHLIPCAKVAQKIYKNLGKNEFSQEYNILTQAALLHDIGKVFIPTSILNKNGKLTAREREIIELHNRLSYEILKTTDLDSQVAQLAYEHHNYDGNVKPSILNQAITVADVYCALRESRPYKRALSDICAKTVLYDMGTKGKFDSRYINLIK